MTLALNSKRSERGFTVPNLAGVPQIPDEAFSAMVRGNEYRMTVEQQLACDDAIRAAEGKMKIIQSVGHFVADEFEKRLRPGYIVRRGNDGWPNTCYVYFSNECWWKFLFGEPLLIELAIDGNTSIVRLRLFVSDEYLIGVASDVAKEIEQQFDYKSVTVEVQATMVGLQFRPARSKV